MHIPTKLHFIFVENGNSNKKSFIFKKTMDLISINYRSFSKETVENSTNKKNLLKIKGAEDVTCVIA